LRARLGEVGVVAVAAPSMKPPGEPVKGAEQGMDAGIKQGAVYSLGGGASLCLAQEPYSCAFGLVAGVLLTPAAAVIGGTVGALRARTKEEVEAAAKQHEQTFAELARSDFSDRLAARLIERARDRWDVRFLRRSPTDDDAGRNGPAGEGVDTALVLDTEFTFAHFGEIDPDMTLEATAVARLTRTGDHITLYRREWKYRGATHGYFELAAAGGAPLRAEIEKAYTALADRIVFDLFIATEPELKVTGRPRGVWTSDAPTSGPIRAGGERAPTPHARQGREHPSRR
jgi:hypothetical protein